MFFRKALAVLLILGFILTINVKPSVANGLPQWVTGQVASIVESTDSSLISILMTDGELVSIPSPNDLLEGVKVGDVVTIQVVEGTANIISVAESAPEPSPEPEEEKKVQWVTGKLLSIERGPENSLLSIKMWDGKVFNVASANDKIGDVKPGDMVMAKVVDGWAESVTKKSKQE